MVNLWIKLKKEDKILADTVESIEKINSKNLHNVLADFAEKFDITTPILLSSHIDALVNFNRTVLLPRDFIDIGDFTCLEIERILN